MAKRVLGVLAGDSTDSDQVRAWADSADVLLAADGGADLLLAIGFRPHHTIGDMDSLSEAARATLSPVEEDLDQNTSDCDKLLRLCRRLGHDSITLVGAEGSRIDHMLGALQSATISDLRVYFGYRRQWARVIRSMDRFELDCNGLLSLMPLTKCQGVTLEGVKWPFHKVTLDALSFTSLSNEGLGRVVASIEQGAAALFVESDGSPRWEQEPTA